MVASGGALLGPGPEPRLRPPRAGEGASTALSELSQRHKEWGTARQGLKACEAAEASAFAALAAPMPIPSAKIAAAATAVAVSPTDCSNCAA